jgi:hypothetical protein
MSKQYLGKEEIKKTEVVGDIKNGFEVEVTFKNQKQYKINKNLFDLVVSDYPNNVGTVEDVVYHRLAQKFIIELGDYGLSLIELEQITSRMNNLLYNSKCEAMGKKFGVKHEHLIKIKDILGV